MRILVFEPLKEPYVKDIEDDIHAMQEVVAAASRQYILNQSRMLFAGAMMSFC